MDRQLAKRPQDRSLYRRAWSIILPTIVEEGVPEPNWSSVFGPMGTTIANLHRVGWFCPEPDRWCDPNGEVWKFSADKAHEGLSALSQALLHSVTEKLNTQASYHRFGEGIQDGIDLHVLKAHLRKLSKLQDHRQEGLLVAASSGALAQFQSARGQP